MRTRLHALALALLVALAGSSCGSDEGGADTPAAGPPDGGGALVEIRLGEFALEPSSLALEPGTYTFAVVNDGAVAHALKVDGPGGESETDLLEPGESAELTVDLSQPGEVELSCPVGDHRDRGMEGTIAVGGGGGETPEETTTDDDGGYDYRY